MEEVELDLIVLKTSKLPKDFQLIATALSKELGIVSITTTTKSPLASPLAHLKTLVRKKGGSLYREVETRPLTFFVELRDHLSHLEMAGCCIQEILKSQLPEKPNEHLFLLLLAILKNIPHFRETPLILTLFFKIKLLLCEGVFSLDSPHIRASSKEEKELLKSLSQCRSFQELKTHARTPLDLTLLSKKISFS